MDKSPESKKFFEFRGLKSRWSKIPGVTWNPEPVNHLYLCRTKKVTVLLRCFSAWILIKIWQRNRLAVWNSNKVFLAGRVFRGVGCSWPCISWLLSLAFSDSWFGLMIRKLSLTLKFIGRVKSKRATINNFFCLYRKPLLFIFLKNLLKNSSLRGFLLQNYFINRSLGRCKRLKLNLVSRDSILLPIWIILQCQFLSDYCGDSDKGWFGWN